MYVHFFVLIFCLLGCTTIWNPGTRFVCLSVCVCARSDMYVIGSYFVMLIWSVAYGKFGVRGRAQECYGSAHVFFNSDLAHAITLKFWCLRLILTNLVSGWLELYNDCKIQSFDLKDEKKAGVTERIPSFASFFWRSYKISYWGRFCDTQNWSLRYRGGCWETLGTPALRSLKGSNSITPPLFGPKSSFSRVRLGWDCTISKKEP